MYVHDYLFFKKRRCYTYNNHENIDTHKLRLDIIFNIQGKDGVMEIGCGEVKKSGVDFDAKGGSQIWLAAKKSDRRERFGLRIGKKG